MTKPSGPEWCELYPTSRRLADLEPGFRHGVTRFLAALAAGGVKVCVSATFRPPERAFLMRTAFDIAFGAIAPAAAPAREGIDIDWRHGGDTRAAIAAAREMVNAYRIVYRPSLTSRHCEGRAIDMTLEWPPAAHVEDADGVLRALGPQTRELPAALIAAGRSYGAIKHPTDRPHWSDDGH